MGALTGCCREGRLKEENEDMTSIEKNMDMCLIADMRLRMKMEHY